MSYNSNIHNRRSIRLRNWNYANPGAYFITICCQNRVNYFGEIVNNEMILNEYGNLARLEWGKLSERYPGIVFDVFQIMPNHIHGIIEIRCMNHDSVPTPVGATLAVALDPDVNSSNQNTHRAGEQRHRAEEQRHRAEAQRHRAEAQRHCTRATARVAPTDNAGNGMDNDANIGRIVGAYKSLVLKKCLEMSKRNNCILGKLWQRNYYEHIIRNEDEYAKIKEYIYNNPILWENDSLNHR